MLRAGPPKTVDIIKKMRRIEKIRIFENKIAIQLKVWKVVREISKVRRGDVRVDRNIRPVISERPTKTLRRMLIFKINSRNKVFI